MRWKNRRWKKKLAPVGRRRKDRTRRRRSMGNGNVVSSIVENFFLGGVVLLSVTCALAGGAVYLAGDPVYKNLQAPAGSTPLPDATDPD